ncbi:hypothetical protein [Burkholderia sp. BCC0322]|uniref:hypothetical protein n=1 Tax=unclassified Burkholderia TaxID=2613784 RepID=UPI00158A02E0|nr:hypothetical protein [Burkholderia sp. BCC0322]
MWLLTFIAIFGLGTAAILFLWPRGRTAHPEAFWILLFGLPSSLFAVLFGMRLNQWEQKKLEFEEVERENSRLMSMWRRWANSRAEVVHATTILGGVGSTGGWEVSDAALPVNLDRPRGISAPSLTEGDQRRKTLFELISDRMSGHLVQTRNLEVALILDEKSGKDRAKWEAVAREAFLQHGRRVTVETLPDSTGLEYLQARMDTDTASAKLIVACQLWQDAKEKPYSEGVAGILLQRKAKANHLRQTEASSTGRYVLRPMLSALDELKSDFNQLLDLQFVREKVEYVWLSGVEDEACSAVQVGAGNHPVTDSACVRNLDVVLGIPGPVNSWVALALTLDIGSRTGSPQLLAVGDGGTRAAMCVVKSTKKDVSN